ncbi:hypothetical protein Goari_023747, partial [Gossypium aridum]|nr:hypothetical protein [Gossypium aridum]
IERVLLRCGVLEFCVHSEKKSNYESGKEEGLGDWKNEDKRNIQGKAEE